ncbi:transcriptional regulator, MerR family protein [mine drainage metagenome]|uniref:Mercuric resistance operon regulatory protein n=2 Tax=mine drainage metagenome TaxID=410659 RepID=T1CR62_9ZZZZ
MSDRALTIGRLARRADVNVETIRYYQRRGLVSEPPRPAYGYRYYPFETVNRVRFIKRAQRLGFTLREIGELLKLSDGHCADVHSLAENKCRRIRAQLRELEALHESLQRLGRCCGDAHDAPTTRCPIIDALMAPGEVAAPHATK